MTTTITPETLELLSNPPMELPLEFHRSHTLGTMARWDLLTHSLGRLQNEMVRQHGWKDGDPIPDWASWLVAAGNNAPALASRVRELELENDTLRALHGVNRVFADSAVPDLRAESELLIAALTAILSAAGSVRIGPLAVVHSLRTGSYVERTDGQFIAPDGSLSWRALASTDHGSPEAAIRAALKAATIGE